MKQSILTSLFIFLATALFAQNNTKDEIAIKNIIQQQEQAWNRHDWKALSSYFTDDATLINFVGQFWQGRDDILAHFNLLNDCCLAPTSLKFEFKQARFLTPDLAIVYTEETLFADKDYEVPFRQYKKGDVDYKWKIEIFVRKNGEWKVTATQMTLINQMLLPHNSPGKN
ncbi:SgcJ/EcaC family oxidoreductase [Mucilaginibacter angelicae]|uniref:SgcJ/EcaC family oxidoreductase n=1 Tax=Mucilaginibacter angelicae TaxID=869718 RepID=A0ABV6LE41_9SPHI